EEDHKAGLGCERRGDVDDVLTLNAADRYHARLGGRRLGLSGLANWGTTRELKIVLRSPHDERRPPSPKQAHANHIQSRRLGQDTAVVLEPALVIDHG